MYYFGVYIFNLKGHLHFSTVRISIFKKISTNYVPEPEYCIITNFALRMLVPKLFLSIRPYNFLNMLV